MADAETGMYADYRKVHPIDFVGKYFKSRGPLNMPPGPQRRPVICQAGGSPAGRAFASKYADTIVAVARGATAAKRYRDDVRARMTGHGRNPDDCKVMFSIGLVLGETMEDARAKKARADAALASDLQAGLARLSFLSGVDFSKFPLDEPLGDVQTNASRGLTTLLTAGTGKATLREMLTDPASGGIDFVGTPDSVAAEMGEAAQDMGGDGFMITEGADPPRHQRDHRRPGAGAEAPRPDPHRLSAQALSRQPAGVLSRPVCRLDQGPKGRVERPSLHDWPPIVERRSLRSGLRPSVETTDVQELNQSSFLNHMQIPS